VSSSRKPDKSPEERAGHLISGGQHEDAVPGDAEQKVEPEGRLPDRDYHDLLLYGPADRARNPPSPYAGSSTGSSHKGGSGSAGRPELDPEVDSTAQDRTHTISSKE